MMGSRNANSPLAPPETNETAVVTTSHNRHEEYVVAAAEVPSSGDATTNIVFPMASPSTILVPSHVTTSIREYVPPAGFTILPKDVDNGQLFLIGAFDSARSLMGRSIQVGYA
ncbi:unnamed protein product [Phytophthora fragariaefolia]|uniref:Unnamed protein product n=1 Tax=Phytophthora fragariaefolia TaxID=1490495 RepID=A0A9W7DAL8_9STRA|nr:unnamed protein product [Phytophthora fragariaefolia]